MLMRDKMFNGSELRLVRVFHGMTLEELGKYVGKSRQYLHKLETGQDCPSEQLVKQLAFALEVEPAFFFKPHTPIISADQCHFRRLLATSSAIQQTFMMRGELIRRLTALLDQELKLPNLNINKVDDVSTMEEVECVAENFREHLHLGLGPIADMHKLAESIGVIISNFDSAEKKVDALAVDAERPIIIYNKKKGSVCRQRFDIAHELGHFVLHSGIVTGDRVTESQTNRFAGALLMPRVMMKKFFPQPNPSFDWKKLSEFKVTWKVSKAAILYRAYQLGLIDSAK
ncbi:MAG: ImmA/IrrE family metallo-endopeptidase, partial [Methylococcales bacterium]|nr:ImmA/IrrE family metallo-endopeptidase [Methylococcales bacterium]